MSSLTPCNLCNLRMYERRAADTQRVVTLVDAPDGGTLVYMHPRGTRPTETHWVAWLMQIPDECVC